MPNVGRIGVRLQGDGGPHWPPGPLLLNHSTNGLAALAVADRSSGGWLTGRKGSRLILVMGSRHATFLLFLVLGARFAAAQELEVSPADALVDSPLVVRVKGLTPRQPFLVRSRLKDPDGRTWQAWAGYLAGTDGTLDLSAAEPAHGSFHARGAQGLFTSMDLPGEAHGRARLQSRTDPLEFEIVLEVERREVAARTAVRRFRPPGGRTEEIRDAGLVGRLFLPEGSGPFPGVVVVLGGSEGGLSGSEEIAAVLSAHGFVALALAYFQMPGLPGSLREIPLEYFDRAIAALLRLSTVRRGGVALVGTSKGAEAALAAAAGSSSTLAVVTLAPSSVVWSCICDDPERGSWSRAGKTVAFVPQGSDPTYRPPPQFPFSPAVNYEYRLRNREAAEKAAIAVERIRGPVFLAAGERDGLWPSAAMARAIGERRRRYGCSPRDETHVYVEAGHFIGLPNLPAGATLVGGRLDAGGTPEANAAASAEMWPRLIAFLSSLHPALEPCRVPEF